jgi:hypothetical protein
MHARFYSVNPKGRAHLGDRVDGRMILKCILKKYCENVDWVHSFRIGLVAG